MAESGSRSPHSGPFLKLPSNICWDGKLKRIRQPSWLLVLRLNLCRNGVTGALHFIGASSRALTPATAAPHHGHLLLRNRVKPSVGEQHVSLGLRML